jgi:hypothetical protein
MEQELHVVEDIVILLFVLFEPILLSIECVSIDSTNIAKTFLILLKFFFFLSNLSELVHDNGTNNLTDDKFYYKEVNKIDNNIEKVIIKKIF